MGLPPLACRKQGFASRRAFSIEQGCDRMQLHRTAPTDCDNSDEQSVPLLVAEVAHDSAGSSAQQTLSQPEPCKLEVPVKNYNASSSNPSLSVPVSSSLPPAAATEPANQQSSSTTPANTAAPTAPAVQAPYLATSFPPPPPSHVPQPYSSWPQGTLTLQAEAAAALASLQPMLASWSSFWAEQRPVMQAWLAASLANVMLFMVLSGGGMLFMLAFMSALAGLIGSLYVLVPSMQGGTTLPALVKLVMQLAWAAAALDSLCLVLTLMVVLTLALDCPHTADQGCNVLEGLLLLCSLALSMHLALSLRVKRAMRHMQRLLDPVTSGVLTLV
ncbi:hypothetical protein V8C86DRAFT_2710168 [Haematococcus lacustris]